MQYQKYFQKNELTFLLFKISIIVICHSESVLIFICQIFYLKFLTLKYFFFLRNSNSERSETPSAELPGTSEVLESWDGKSEEKKCRWTWNSKWNTEIIYHQSRQEEQHWSSKIFRIVFFSLKFWNFKLSKSVKSFISLYNVHRGSDRDRFHFCFLKFGIENFF